ncbi:hypothetical protein BDV96DRAFT_41281 [Lophiotrema nucula]|uniref:ATPase AAA-type core domain-containing protein n=1 Tax=Lophiotrema nucula TaxID=690887 RepID=A0A6A5ZA50_9PLEO|nr:hypothetical protein BDV96DRAFT_41281 [Lophiotrema nucula]
MLLLREGKGIIALFSSNPQIEKTLTAEVVAENMKVPLYTITTGDLGSNAIEVDFGLTSALDSVARSNAILLIDVCDVFLEAP